MIFKTLLILITFCSFAFSNVIIDRECVYGDDISSTLPHVKIACGFGFNEEKVIPASLILQKTSLKSVDIKPLTKVRRQGVLLGENDIKEALKELLSKYKEIEFVIKKINYNKNIYVRSKGEFSLDIPKKNYGSINIILNNGQKSYLIYAYIEAFKEGYVADKKISSGEEIKNSVRKTKINITNLRDELVTDIGKFSAKKRISPNRPITMSDVYLTYDIKKGDIIKILYISDTIKVETMGESLEDGYKGKKIRIKNLTSGKIITAVYRGQKVAVVTN